MPHKEQKFYATSSSCSPSTVVFLTNLLAVGHQLLFELDSGEHFVELGLDHGQRDIFSKLYNVRIIARIAQLDARNDEGLGMMNKNA